MWSGQLRRSSRIVELQAKRANNKEKAEDVVTASDDSDLKLRRKKVKIRPVQELVSCSVDYQLRKEDGNSSNEVCCTNDAALSSGTTLPERRKLELLLGILKRRDKHNLFAKPVNPEEAEGYYDEIKEPMDFGTITAKLNGIYRTLEEFERDVYLVWNNAKRFYRSTTKHYRQAVAIKYLAMRLFDALRNDPENFESCVAMTRLRAGRRAKTEVNNLNSPDRSINGMASKGCSGERSYEYSELDRRQTYTSLPENESIVSAVYHSSKDLIQTKQNSIGYRDSLMRFVKDLGPVAQMVAKKKFEKGAEDLNPHKGTLNFQGQALDQGIRPTDLGGPQQPVFNKPFQPQGWNASTSELGPQKLPVFNKPFQQQGWFTSTSGLGGPQQLPVFNKSFQQQGGITSSSELGGPQQLPVFNKPFQQQGWNTSSSELGGPEQLPIFNKPFQQQGRITSSSELGGPQQLPVFNKPFQQQGWNTSTSEFVGPQQLPVFNKPFQQQGWNTSSSELGGPQQLPVFNKPFQQQGWVASTSGTSGRPIELSDIDEWLHVGRRSRGGLNIGGATPTNSQQQAAPGTNVFPWTLRL